MAKIDRLLDKVDSKYTLVHLAASRARDISQYYQYIGSGQNIHIRPLVESASNKPLSIALDEIAEGKVIVGNNEETQEQVRKHFDSLLDGDDFGLDDDTEVVDAPSMTDAMLEDLFNPQDDA